MAAHAPFEPSAAHSQRDLVLLRQNLLEARQALVADRCGPQTAPTVHLAAAAELLHCLQAYVEALTERRLPVPPALRDELRLRQALTWPQG